jgi:transposase InsO family protein
MSDRIVNQRRWSHRNVSKAVRYLGSELKRRPAFLKGLETRLTVTGVAQDKQLHVDGKQVVAIEDVPAVIKSFDDNPRYGGGRDRLYEHIAREKVGITRRAVMDYISNSEVHQLTRPKPRVVRHRAIITTDVGKKAQCDLIGPWDNPALNNGYSYICTFIDLFSKFAAARPLKSKAGPGVIAAIDSILESIKPEHRPRVLQSDRGSEFAKAFEAHLKKKWGIKTIHSAPYRPQTQGAIERFNGTLKALLYSHMAKYGSKRWVDILDAVVENHNTSKHSVSGYSPLQVLENPKLRSEVASNIRSAAEERKGPADAKERELSVGDSVRVALTTRAQVRKGQLFAKSAGKQHWSNRVYVVRSISRPAEAFQRKQFLLQYGKRALTKRFYASQLMKIDVDKLVKNELTIADRPTYSDTLFDSEKHLRVDLPSRTVVDSPAQTHTVNIRPKRERRAPQRYGVWGK